MNINNTSRETLAKSFKGVGAELGVSRGRFSEVILKNSTCELLYSIDMWSGDRGHGQQQFLGACSLLSTYGKRSKIIKSTFENTVNQFNNEYFDFVYIDGYAHTGQENGKTLTDWWPKVKNGGLFAGHDYDNDRWPLTVTAVNQFTHSVNKDVKLTNEKRDRSWYIIK